MHARLTQAEQLNRLANDPLFQQFLADCDLTGAEASFRIGNRAVKPRYYRQLKSRADALLWGNGATPPRGIYFPTLIKRLNQVADRVLSEGV